IGHSLYSDIIKGIQDEASNEYDILVAAGYSTVGTELRLLGMLTNHTVDAAVMLGTRVDAATLDSLAERYCIALCAESTTGSDTLTIMIDNEKAAYDVVNRFAAAGKKRIAFVTTDSSVIAPTSDARLEGYTRALKDNDMPVREEYIFRRNYDYTCGIEAANTLMKLPEPPDAVLCISDLLAVGFIKGCKAMGISVPDDIEVCGFDNISLCEMFTPMITTVSQPAYRMGRTTARRIIDQLKSGIRAHGTEYIDYDIITRESARI
ncbi:MAG: substrate-binding domain-containing protein, partial [Oscillospiraceae bacterium]|nr:substrate-binding domain-containing protein [Oscillospiraceae bacterium]